MKLSTRHGRVELRLDATEASVLTALLDELATVVAAEDADDPVVARLFPSAYPDDDAAQADYRSITQDGLRSERQERISACGAELVGPARLDLTDPDRARRWIQTFNDLRLALGTRLGVTEDYDEPDPGEPEYAAWNVYGWLTMVQDTVVTALMS